MQEQLIFEGCKCIGIYGPEVAVPGSVVEILVKLEGVSTPFHPAEVRAVLVNADTEEIIEEGEKVSLWNGQKHTWVFKVTMPEHDLRVYALGQEEDPWPIGWKTECQTPVLTIKAVTPEEEIVYKAYGWGRLALLGAIGAGIGYGLAAAMDKDPIPFAIGGAATAVGLDVFFREVLPRLPI